MYCVGKGFSTDILKTLLRKATNLYPPTPSGTFLSIRRPPATTMLHGPPCFLVNILHTVAALVQLRELQGSGQANVPQIVAEQLGESAQKRGALVLVGEAQRLLTIEDSKALDQALLELALRFAQQPWLDFLNNA